VNGSPRFKNVKPMSDVKATNTSSRTKKRIVPKRPRSAPPTRPGPAAPRDLYVLSDSTGGLARHMLAAFMTQFPTDAFAVHFHTFIRGEHRLGEILEIIRARPGAICHAMVSDAFKRTIAAFCRKTGLAQCDLTGGVVDFLAAAAGVPPQCDVAALHRMDEAYRKRIGAIEYTIAHDDGLGLSTLSDADIVLAGVSRTGKTPTSIYLAQQGYRVANVSLALEVAPPPELLSPRGRKVVGLVINPQQLVMIRTRRETNWGMERTTYGDPAHVAREIAWARQLFVRQGWPLLDVTDQAIEETAAKVIEALGLAGGAADPSAGAEL
jgi:[pyruvate, water dikinase]-phosphate phosphotransferase / [pyruvate, water dikinase] kinase